MPDFDFAGLLAPLLAHPQVVYFAYDLAARRVLHVSAAYEQLIGDPLSHLNDDLPHLLARVHPDDWRYLQQQLAQTRPGALLPDVELRLARPPHDTQWLCVSISCPAQPTGRNYLVGAARDITTHKATLRNAQKFNAKKDATLEILSHDLATPLALLQQLADQLAYEVARPSDTVRHLLHLMQTTCTQGIKLIHEFVDNEFLESAHVRLNRERTDVASWLHLLLREYQRGPAPALTQFVDEVPTEPLYASIDINKFQQVINNLLSNALKFTPDGGAIRLGLRREADTVVITVADTGIGIPAHLQPKLFDKFTQARRPGLRGEKATGLGMSIIQTIVGLHEGRVWLESTEGQGTTFFVQLPASPDA